MSTKPNSITEEKESLLIGWRSSRIMEWGNREDKRRPFTFSLLMGNRKDKNRYASPDSTTPPIPQKFARKERGSLVRKRIFQLFGMGLTSLLVGFLTNLKVPSIRDQTGKRRFRLVRWFCRGISFTSFYVLAASYKALNVRSAGGKGHGRY